MKLRLYHDEIVELTSGPMRGNSLYLSICNWNINSLSAQKVSKDLLL